MQRSRGRTETGSTEPDLACRSCPAANAQASGTETVLTCVLQGTQSWGPCESQVQAAVEPSSLSSTSSFKSTEDFTEVWQMYTSSSSHSQYLFQCFLQDSVAASGEGMKSHSSPVSPFCGTSFSVVPGSSSFQPTQDDGTCICFSSQKRLFPGMHLA